ncbi:hypothetical protein LUZ62_065383 [Rhynchospora pubera]|uniref:SCP domain-containing protein n=1 Tax=Rhynchospora pubera TaxID=906938 RepID=A0AAV8EQQ2_9POAL|nr:hypothetical protein LUZ62_065383 [Rhynchospora pubera]
MDRNKSNLTFLLFLSSLLAITIAQNSVQDIIKAHNEVRAEVNLPPLRWSKKLARYARTYAKKRVSDCRTVHSGGAFGENLFWGNPGGLYLIDAVYRWAEEKQFYDYKTNKCVAGQKCGHYTQLVWARTLRVGCAKETCHNGDDFMICSYSPAGNIKGQKPY